ncbi:SAM-dependent methyltransferase [Streptantibioticus rubrisoli]|uniref:Class I SAM-dependent methyltransferase n=1 Tax=Streptantibioticus rubrisoli TaxID=1387313 RepID=A0ABT1PJL2_9ACTN|nr:class I SAM-dependent methyltransferase [Streptantibioticus rubrisoli]MCQ4044986.1 class I SAM-dependent methyltransferase [Streptantibioticus rubrisoli]
MTDATPWDAYAQTKPHRRETNAAGERTWFNWTQFPDHGPGAELLRLGQGASVLELGCGEGGNLAHVATLGVRAVGVDVSLVQIKAAEERWGGAPGLELHRCDAVDYLTEVDGLFDAVYSVFGAVWFTDPDVILPKVSERLRPRGVFAFSQRPPMEGCYGCQASYISDPDSENPLVVRRWDYTANMWIARLRKYGFVEVSARVIPAPVDGRSTGTLLVHAVQAAE